MFAANNNYKIETCREYFFQVQNVAVDNMGFVLKKVGLEEVGNY